MSPIIDLIEYAKKVIALTRKQEQLTGEVADLRSDLGDLESASIQILQLSTSNRDRAIDFRQRSENRQSDVEQDVRELREQIRALTDTVNVLTRQVDSDRDRAEGRHREAELAQQLQVEKMKNSVSEMQNQMFARFFALNFQSHSGATPSIEASQENVDDTDPSSKQL